jgi:hypothetical protein
LRKGKSNYYCLQIPWSYMWKTPRLHQKSVRINKRIEQSCMLQNQHAEINSAVICQLPITWDRNLIYNSYKKYLGIHLVKKEKYLCNENYKILMKEIEEDTQKWKNMLCSWFGRTNIVWMSILSLIRFSAIRIKMPKVSFT